VKAISASVGRLEGMNAPAGTFGVTVLTTVRTLVTTCLLVWVFPAPNLRVVDFFDELVFEELPLVEDPVEEPVVVVAAPGVTRVVDVPLGALELSVSVGVLGFAWLPTESETVPLTSPLETVLLPLAVVVVDASAAFEELEVEAELLLVPSALAVDSVEPDPLAEPDPPEVPLRALDADPVEDEPEPDDPDPPELPLDGLADDEDDLSFDCDSFPEPPEDFPRALATADVPSLSFCEPEPARAPVDGAGVVAVVAPAEPVAAVPPALAPTPPAVAFALTPLEGVFDIVGLLPPQPAIRTAEAMEATASRVLGERKG
jgi:hypothetical protein